MWQSRYEVYRLKEARRRNIQPLKTLLTKPENSNTHLDEDDNDSGISIHGNGNNGIVRSHGSVNNGTSNHGNTNGSISSSNLSKTELITRLSTSSLKNPAYIKAKVLLDFKTSRPGTELSVERGENVYLLYREQDKVLVVNSEGKRGFVPLRYCSLLNKKRTSTTRQLLDNEPSFKNYFIEMERVNQNIRSTTRHTNSWFKSSDFQRELPNISSSSEEDADLSFRGTSRYSDFISWGRKSPVIVRERPKTATSFFRKAEDAKMNVLYDFIARDENDISVYKGETITVLNREDIDWWWVVTPEGYEGFVPKSYLSSHSDSSEASTTSNSTESSSSTSEGSSTQVRFQEPLCTFHRYEKEEWETNSEIAYHDDGYPVDRMDKEPGRGDSLKWGTWC